MFGKIKIISNETVLKLRPDPISRRLPLFLPFLLRGLLMRFSRSDSIFYDRRQNRGDGWRFMYIYQDALPRHTYMSLHHKLTNRLPTQPTSENLERRPFSALSARSCNSAASARRNGSTTKHLHRTHGCLTVASLETTIHGSFLYNSPTRGSC